MLSMREISRIYSLRSLKKHWMCHWSRTFNLCTMWKALVVVPYNTLPGERHWSWYRMTYCHVKHTGCLTIWRIVMLHWSWYRMAHCHVVLVVVPYDTLPGEKHWSWYRMTHCQVRGTGRGTVWHIARGGDRTHDALTNWANRPLQFIWRK
jgi:hypothetical protein